MVGVDCFDVPKFTTKYWECQSCSNLQRTTHVPDRWSQTCLLPQGFEPVERVNASAARCLITDPTRMTYIFSISGFSPPFAMVCCEGLRNGLGRCSF